MIKGFEHAISLAFWLQLMEYQTKLLESAKEQIDELNEERSTLITRIAKAFGLEVDKEDDHPYRLSYMFRVGVSQHFLANYGGDVAEIIKQCIMEQFSYNASTMKFEFDHTMIVYADEMAAALTNDNLKRAMELANEYQRERKIR